MLVDIIDQPVRIFTHTEEISLFFGRLHFAAAVRTFAVHQLGLCPERLAGRAVKSLIRTFVNVSLLIQLFENLLYLFFMILIRGPDKFIVRGVHKIPDILNLACHPVHEFLRSDSCLFCLQFDLLSVLVGSCLEEHVKAAASFVPCDRIRQNRLIGVADVRFPGGIRNGSRNIVLLLFHNTFSPFPQNKKTLIFPYQ